MEATSNLKLKINKYIENCDRLAQLSIEDEKAELEFHGEVAQLTLKHSKDPSQSDSDILKCNKELEDIINEIENLESNMNVIESQISYVENLTDNIIEKLNDVELLNM